MKTQSDDLARRAVEAVARQSYGRLVALLSARTRDVAAAEDALADALMSALTTWPRDGIPRNPAQAKLVEEHLQVLRIVYLLCADEEAMIHRIKRRAIRENRYDDANEDVIRRRFEVYRRETQPVLDCYPNEIVSTIDAIGSPAEVLRNILECLIPIQNEHFRSGWE